jgi:hypothetical protein
MTSELEHLRNRVDELEELCGLRETIPPSVIENYRRRDGTVCISARRLTVILQLLLKREMVSVQAILLAIGGDRTGDTVVGVMLVAVRRFLRDHSINLKNHRGEGWSLPADDKRKLRELIEAQR